MRTKNSKIETTIRTNQNGPDGIRTHDLLYLTSKILGGRRSIQAELQAQFILMNKMKDIYLFTMHIFTSTNA